MASTGHVIYPLFLAVSTWRRSDEDPPRPATWPALTVVVPAFREEAVIEAKVADLQANGYGGPLLVVVVADDDPTAAAARSTSAIVVALPERRGKAHAINVGMAQASTDLVVVTDANTQLLPGSLSALVRWFDDATVGAVAGEKTLAGDAAEGIYWRFESWLKSREARTGFTVGLVGELAAVRRDVFRPLPLPVPADDLWMALDVLESGLRVMYDPSARAVEDPPAHWRADWERRTRVGSAILDALWRRRDRLAPRHGMAAAQLWGHRAVRSSFGPLAHLVLLLMALRSFRRSRIAAGFVMGHLVAGGAMVRTQQRTARTRAERLLGQTLYLQVVGLGGLLRFLRGDRPGLWQKPERAVVVDAPPGDAPF